MEKLNYESDKSKKFLLNLLHDCILKINFIKVDGTERLMLCTLNQKLLPKIEVDESKEIKPRKESTTAFVVFDIEKQELRSIRWDSMTSISILELLENDINEE